MHHAQTATDRQRAIRASSVVRFGALVVFDASFNDLRYAMLTACTPSAPARKSNEALTVPAALNP